MALIRSISGSSRSATTGVRRSGRRARETVEGLSKGAVQADHELGLARQQLGCEVGRWTRGDTMRHRPFFRWVLTLGVLLFGWSAYLYASYPETRQIDLTVISEKPDGRCTVRWKDPYTDGGRWRATAYRCDPDRDALLKAPNYDEDTGYGWDSGFMFTEGRHKGDLEPSLEEKEPYGLSDALVLIGLALTAVGLIGGTPTPRYA